MKAFARRFAQVLAQTEPDRFTAALTGPSARGASSSTICAAGGATAIMTYSACAREHAPVAVPITWGELRTLDGASRWHVGDASELLKRAASRDLIGRGRVDQVLPDL